MTRLTRRRFIAIAALAAASMSAGAAWTQRRAVKRWLLHAPPDRSAPGPLSLRAEVVLRAAVPALLGEPIDPAHYVSGFQWRAARLPGHRERVERFAEHLDAGARRFRKRGFEELTRAQQQRLLADVRPLHGWRRVWRSVSDHDRARDAEQVVGGMLATFASTDAWVRLGYEAWPGTPRGITVAGGAGA